MKLVTIVVMYLGVLLGCSEGPSYVKAGASESDLRQAISDCRARHESSALNRAVQQKNESTRDGWRRDLFWRGYGRIDRSSRPVLT